MYEVWELGGKFNTYRPVAWFNTEEYAQDYTDYLLTLGRTSKIVYNAMAIMGEWDTPEDFKETIQAQEGAEA